MIISAQMLKVSDNPLVLVHPDRLDACFDPPARKPRTRMGKAAAMAVVIFYPTTFEGCMKWHNAGVSLNLACE